MQGMSTRDVAVIGLGVMGAMTLWQVAQRCKSVIGFEQFEPGHSRGSSHGGSRIFRRIGTEGSHYVPLVRRADALWNELEAAGGTKLRTVTGGLTIGTTGGHYIHSALAAAESGQVDIEVLDARQIRRRFPQHAVFDDDTAVYEPGAGVLFPETAIRVAIDRAVQDGAEVRTGERIIALVADGDGFRIETDAAMVHASRVVVATGAWLTELLPTLDLPVRVQRSVPYWFTHPDEAGFGPDAFPVFRRKSRHLSGWGIPNVDGRGVKIGVSGAPKPWLRRPEDNWVGEGAADFSLVRQFTAEAFPALRDKSATAYPCMNARTPDGDFLIGRSSRAPGVVVLGGFSGHGFKYAAAVGEIAADLALDGRPEVPIEAFSPDRFLGQWDGPFEPVFEPTGPPAQHPG